MKSLTPDIIIDYWYTERIAKQWFNATPELDDEIRNQFESVWMAAASGELDGWQSSGEGCLALCIILDQFPLNMYRGEPRSFETESKAISIARYAVAEGLDQGLEKIKRIFLYMPFMHSENLDDQKTAIKLFDAAGLKDNAEYARHHHDIVQRFGRFPHRNAILGRESSAEEMQYLSSEGAFTG